MRCCDARFRDSIKARCVDALIAEGFTKYRKDRVDWPIHDGFHCWVGLNDGLYSDYVEINPFVGIHVVPLMRLAARLEGRKYSRGTATYAVHMGELAAAKEERAFAFGPQQSEGFIQEECERLARLYATVGLDYARSIASYEALLPLLEQRIDMLGAYPERYACCLYLMGRKDEARAFTESFLQKHRDYFEGFAIPFLDMLEREESADGAGSRD